VILKAKQSIPEEASSVRDVKVDCFANPGAREEYEAPKRFALQMLSYGHVFYSPSLAQQLSEVFGLQPPPEEHFVFWSSQQEARERYGLQPRSVGPGRAIYALTLCHYIAQGIVSPKNLPSLHPEANCDVEALQFARAISAELSIPF
jgi:hypothetical protein